MGRWIDYLKRMRKPEHINTEVKDYGKGKGKLLIRFQYAKPNLHTKEIIVDEVSLWLRDLPVDVETGEIWGDWGGPIMVGKALYISKKVIP